MQVVYSTLVGNIGNGFQGYKNTRSQIHNQSPIKLNLKYVFRRSGSSEANLVLSAFRSAGLEQHDEPLQLASGAAADPSREDQSR